VNPVSDADIRVRGLERSSESQVYLPYRQRPHRPGPQRRPTPRTFASVVGLTLLRALGGTLFPTLRALRIDPITAIRAE
jgi:hypothetical protein